MLSANSGLLQTRHCMSLTLEVCLPGRSLEVCSAELIQCLLSSKQLRRDLISAPAPSCKYCCTSTVAHKLAKLTLTFELQYPLAQNNNARRKHDCTLRSALVYNHTHRLCLILSSPNARPARQRRRSRHISGCKYTTDAVCCCMSFHNLRLRVIAELQCDQVSKDKARRKPCMPDKAMLQCIAAGAATCLVRWCNLCKFDADNKPTSSFSQQQQL